RIRTSAFAALALALLAAAGCGSGGSAEPETSQSAQQAAEIAAAAERTPIFSLPPPSGLQSALANPGRQSMAAPGNWRSEGSEFSPGLPHSRVLADVNRATFSPQWSSGDPLSE